MSAADVLIFAWGAVTAHRLRSALTILGIVIGITAVILLTSLGEGTRQYILGEFTQFGTNLVAINPGKTATSGFPGALGATIRDLTLDDAESLRRVPGVIEVMPVQMGMARVASGDRGRSVTVYGVTSAAPDIFRFGVRQGAFLPAGDPRRGARIAVLGPKLKHELFGEANALGERVRIGGWSFRVTGVMEPKGKILGFDIDDTAFIPVATAATLFNRSGLFEVDLLFDPMRDPRDVVARVRAVLMSRHDGEEDFGVTTQAQMLEVLGRILGIVNMAVAAIGAISLLVGAIGILTMMWITVNERTSEIGLAKAIGATSGQVQAIFLAESTLLSLIGGLLGVALGLGIAHALRSLVPGLPVETPVPFVVAALVVSLFVGVLSGVLPARRAVALDPLEALRDE